MARYRAQYYCGGLCMYAGRMCDECRSDPNEHAYRLLCGWCAEPLDVLDQMYCSDECARNDQAAIDIHMAAEMERGI